MQHISINPQYQWLGARLRHDVTCYACKICALRAFRFFLPVLRVACCKHFVQHHTSGLGWGPGKHGVSAPLV